ncbi:pentraxin-4-like [Anguilla anguilla]|uniref:pentraxin-4-like n=1 Tax=Anguilla anguilla TaxID=7936 RepID=UPI0015B28705|nr:pentraxin-4-like [Anguilla anguilla]
MNVPQAWTGLLLFLTASLCAQTTDGQAAPPLALRKPFFERLRRLDEQFRRFQEMTLTQLQGIAENYNISYNIDARFQQLAEQQQNLSDSLAAFQASAASDLGSLKLWTKKLQKKTERLDLKVSELEQTLEESSRRAPSPGESPEEQGARISNVTQELQEHRARLDVITADRDEVRGGLRELRESLGRQESRMVQLEEQVRSTLQQGRASLPGPREDEIESNLTPQDLGPRAMATGRGHGSPKFSAKLQLKHSKGMKAKEGLRVHHEPPQKETEPQPLPYPQEEPLELWDQPQPDSQKEPTDIWDSPQPRPQEQPIEIWEQSLPHPQSEPKEIWEESQLRPHEESVEIWEQSQPRQQEEPMNVWEQSQPRPQEEPMEIWEQSQPRPQEEPTEWEMPHQQEELRDVLDLPQLPLRHKIPQHPHVTKNTGTTCNVKSSLTFPSASTHNYVTFKKGFATGVHELSVCTWLRVGAGAGYIGTLLSYATEDNDNKLVLYGRNSTRRGSLDFVIGDPVYRELPVEGMLDGNWHHLCVVWSSIEGRFWHYTDRRLTSTGSRFRKGYEIPAGGAVVLGQEQDAVGGGFDEAEAFVGSLAGFAAWDRALSPGEVSEVATGRGLPRGAVLTLDDIRQPNGDVRLVRCDCLEQCP